MFPKIIEGNSHNDIRGTLSYNNDFDTTTIKRIYVIENQNTEMIRAWQGHKIEQRWFSVISGAFKIELIAIDDWDIPSKNMEKIQFVLYSEKLDVLHIPAGYVSSIQSLEKGSKLLVMADHFLGEIDDEFRYSFEYFD